MFKNFFIISLVLCSLFSCTKTNISIDNEDQSQLDFSQASEELRQSAKKAFSKSKAFNAFAKNGNNVQFDFENALSASTEEGIEVLVVYQVAFDESNHTNYLLSFTDAGSEVNPAVVGKLVNLTSSQKEMELYSFEGNLNAVINYDFENESVEVKSSNGNNLLPNFTSNSKCGQEIMDCIDYLYNDAGWASVANWVLTAIFPAQAIGNAALCASYVC